MRFRLGMVIGFGAGYYLGSMAGRERYEQINRTLSKIKRSEPFEVATETAKSAVEVGVERAKEVVDSTFGNGEEPDRPADPYLRSTTDL